MSKKSFVMYFVTETQTENLSLMVIDDTKWCTNVLFLPIGNSHIFTYFIMIWSFNLKSSLVTMFVKYQKCIFVQSVEGRFAEHLKK